MSVQNKSRPVMEHLVDKFGEWLSHRRDLSELRQLDRSNFDEIARDLRVSPDDLETMVCKGPHATDELPKLLKALGIDESDLSRAQPLVLRDMQRVCAMCQDKNQCDRDLAAGSSAEHYRGYCLNADTIDGLGSAAPGK